jgi:hypothetical protein
MRHGLSLLAGVGLVLGGCASFPKQPPLIGYDPTPYADAFRSVATEAAIRQRTGKGFYEALGEKAYILSIRPPHPCSADGFAAFARGEFACSPVGNAYRPDCQELDSCLSFTIDRGLAQDREFMAAVLTAVEQPCRALTPPSGNPHHAYHAAGGIVLPPSYLWRYFRCSTSRQVQGRNIQTAVTEDHVLITLRFGLERGEPRSGGVSPFDRGRSPRVRIPPPPPPPSVRPGLTD